MNALLAAFGIDWRLLLINLLNFGILLAVLWYFLYTPLTKMLEARRQRVIEGVERANEADRKLVEIEESRADLLARAGKEAEDVVATARTAALQKQQEIIAQGETGAANILSDAQAQAAELKREALAQSKQEVAKLIVLGMDRLAEKRT